MKHFLILTIVALFWTCSNFDEGFEIPKNHIPFEQIETLLPVINIEVDDAAFQDMSTRVEEEIEINGYFNLYRNHELLIEKEAVELEIKGNYSTRFTLKTLGVKFEDKYDNRDRSLINPEQVLPFHNIDQIKAIRLRNSGNDFEKTMLKDLSFTQLAVHAGLDLDLAYGEPSLVYVNGDFYGLLNIRTEANTNGIAGLYRLDKDEITLAKVTTHELIKKDGDFARIDSLVEAVNRKDIAYLKNEIDIDNFIDYMVFESYLGNVDWPHNNARFYATEGEKFRFVLFDLDNVSWLKLNKAPLTIIEEAREENMVTDLFFALYDDQEFKQAYWDRFEFLLQSSEISYDKFEVIVDSNSDRIRSEMLLQIEKHKAPRTMIEWDIELDKLRQLFQEREMVIKSFFE